MTSSRLKSAKNCDFKGGVTDGPTDGPTDGRTDGPTDGRTDRPSYRDAWTHLKSDLTSVNAPAKRTRLILSCIRTCS